MVVKTGRFPQPGETILGGTFLMNPGGKGANQAVAAARLGANVTLVTKLGKDIFGENAVEGLKKDHINTDHIFHDKTTPSGVALITVDANGQNNIVVASGANMMLNVEDIYSIRHLFTACDLVLMQLEIPLPTIVACVALCSQLHKPVIINPAPAAFLDDELLKNLFLITPNEHEAEIVTGIAIRTDDDIKAAALYLKDKGVQNVVITLGAKGVYILNDDLDEFIAAPTVNAIDTTAAGDVFNGALASALAATVSWKEAIEFANKAAAISVTRMGAQSSAPYAEEIYQPD